MYDKRSSLQLNVDGKTAKYISDRNEWTKINFLSFSVKKHLTKILQNIDIR